MYYEVKFIDDESYYCADEQANWGILDYWQNDGEEIDVWILLLSL